MDKNKSIKNMIFEEAIAELEEIVNQIDTGHTSLEDAISKFERGNLLKQHCEKLLGDAKLKIDKIVKEGDNIRIEEATEMLSDDKN